MSGGLLRRRSVEIVGALVALACVAVVSLIALRDNTEPAYFKSAPSASLTAIATSSIAQAGPNGGCVLFGHGSRETLPLPYQLCAYHLGRGGEALFLTGWKGGDLTGLVYQSDVRVPSVSDRCVKKLAPRWWAMVTQGDAANPCGAGFTFTPAP
jgi:hypothetical protein